MANDEHVRMLVNSTAEEWNAWRESNPWALVDLSGAPLTEALRCRNRVTAEDLVDLRCLDLRRSLLHRINFDKTDLSKAIINDAFPLVSHHPVPAQYDAVIFSNCKMHETVIRNGTFRNCFFGWSNMTAADLTDSKFPKSSFMNTCLSNARVVRTDFRDAELMGADFSDCDLRLTSLTGASLACSRLHLAMAIVDDMPIDDVLQAIRDDFDGSLDDYLEWISETEEALLNWTPGNEVHKSDDAMFEKGRRYGRYMGTTYLPMPKEQGTVKSVQELLDKLDCIKSQYEIMFGPDAARYYYRGEESNKWSLTPSLHRRIKGGSESELVRELMTRVPDRFRDTVSPFDRLVVAQQHGLPTRLLDVTRNPLAALFFAARLTTPDAKSRPDLPARVHIFVTPTGLIRRDDDDSVKIAAAFSELSWMEQDVILTRCFEWRDDPWPAPIMPHDTHAMPSYRDVVGRIAELLSPTNLYLADRFDPKALFRVHLVEPKRSFDRIRAQSGAFLLSAYHTRFEREKVFSVNRSVRIYDHYTIDVDISGDLRKRMLKQLDYLNINEETMFPGLESAAKAIAAQHAKPSLEDKRDTDNRSGDATGSGPSH